MPSSILHDIHFSDVVLFVILLYIVLFFLILWIRYCVQYGIFCPFSPTQIHCCFIPKIPKELPNICTNCGMKKLPTFPYCCDRKHNLYDCCKCPDFDVECFKPECSFACCCCQFSSNKEGVNKS